MADTSLELIKELRERTGAGVMDCKRALEQGGGNLDKAAQILAEQGMAMAAKKANRETAQGVVDCYIHAGGRIGSIVEVNCETDFVARTDEFKAFAHDLAMQVAATSPQFIIEDEVPSGFEGLPTDAVLMLQPFIKEPGKSIRQLVNEMIGKTGENIQVRRFSRFELGQ